MRFYTFLNVKIFSLKIFINEKFVIYFYHLYFYLFDNHCPFEPVINRTLYFFPLKKSHGKLSELRIFVKIN